MLLKPRLSNFSWLLCWRPFLIFFATGGCSSSFWSTETCWVASPRHWPALGDSWWTSNGLELLTSVLSFTYGSFDKDSFYFGTGSGPWIKVGIMGAGLTWGDLDCLPLLSFFALAFAGAWPYFGAAALAAGSVFLKKRFFCGWSSGISILKPDSRRELRFSVV